MLYHSPFSSYIKCFCALRVCQKFELKMSICFSTAITLTWAWKQMSVWQICTAGRFLLTLPAAQPAPQVNQKTYSVILTHAL